MTKQEIDEKVQKAAKILAIDDDANICDLLKLYLEKEGYEVKNADFFKIGIPFTLSAIVPAYILIWILFG